MSSITKKLVVLNTDNLNQAELEIIKLKHPKDNELVPFLVSIKKSNQVEINERVSYTQDLGTMFIDEYVQSECSIYMSSRYNVNYFLISFVSNLTKFEFDSIETLHAKFIEFITDDKNLNKDSCLNKLVVSVSSLNKLFDVKETNDKKVEVKWNASKVLDWLKSKVEQLKENLERNAALNAAQQLTKIKQTEEEDNSAKFRLEAFELLAQYVDKNVGESMRKELNLQAPLETSENKRAKQRLGVITKVE